MLVLDVYNFLFTYLMIMSHITQWENTIWVGSIYFYLVQSGFPQSLKSPWILGFPWKVLENEFFLEFRGPSLKFQLVVLDFLFFVFWTESLNGYSKLRGTRANFSPKNSARFARSSLQVKYLSSSSCSYIILVQLLSYPSFPKNIYVCYVFQCISLFQNGQSLLLLRNNNKLVYPPELSRIAGFCINSNKFFLGEDPRPPIKQNCLSLYYNHITANHLKKLKTQTQISPRPPPPPHHFSGEFKIKWSLYVLFEKSIVDHFFANECLKEQRKVIENSLKMYLKSPWKVLEKDISWSVRTMTINLCFTKSPLPNIPVHMPTEWLLHGHDCSICDFLESYILCKIKKSYVPDEGPWKYIYHYMMHSKA